MNEQMNRGAAATPQEPGADPSAGGQALGAAVRAVILVTGFAMISLRGGLANAPALWQGIAWAGAVYLVLSAILAWRRPAEWERLSLGFTSLDIFWITWLIWITRETGSLYLLYYVPVLYAGMRLSRRDAVSAALLSAICYMFVVAMLGRVEGLHGLVLPMIFTISAIAIAALFGAMTERTRRPGGFGGPASGGRRPVEALYSLRSAASSAEPEAVPRAIADVVCKAMDAQAVRLSIVGGRTGELQVAAVVGPQSGWLREDPSLAEHIASQDEPLVASGRTPKELADKGLTLPAGAGSYIGVPLRCRGRLVGVLETVWKAKRPLEDDLDSLLILGAEAAQQLTARVEIGPTRAGRDAVTGMWSHSEFHQRLSEDLSRAARAEQPLAVLIIDIDGFSTFNERHGHRWGDSLLAAVARRLQSRGRAADFLARYGADEFAVLLPDTDRAGAMLAAERFREMVAEAPFAMPGGITESVTVSVSIACFPSDAATGTELIEAAAKPLRSEGTDRVVCAGE